MRDSFFGIQSLNLIIGLVFVVASSIPWGMAEGEIINMAPNYKAKGFVIVTSTLFFAFGLYLIGFALAPINLALVTGVWEFGAISVAILTAAKDKEFSGEKLFLFLLMGFGIAIMVYAVHRLYGVYDVP